MSIDVATGVLANDSDANGNSITATLVSGSSDGTLTLNADGSFTYTPDTDFVGSDSFTYKANDGFDDGGVATVTLNVYGGPVWSFDDQFTVIHDITLTVAAAGVLANDWGQDGDSLSSSLISDVSNGTLTLNADGSFTYTPDTRFIGTDSFTYEATDGTLVGNAATVTIAVTNMAPSSTTDWYHIDHDTTLAVAAAGVLGNDADYEADTLTATLVSDVSFGTLAFNSDGSFDYTPDGNFVGADSFTYRANDGFIDGNVATVTIDVANEPGQTVDDAYRVKADTTLTVEAAGVLFNDYDPNGDTLTATLADAPANGTVTLNGDGSFTYTPDAGFVGADSFTYLTNDGLISSEVATVILGVDNQAPAAIDDYYGIPHDTALQIAASGVLANDYDLEEHALTATLVQLPVSGSLTFNADGSLTYTPNAGFVGADTFQYAANDGYGDGNTATVTINVTNEAPTAYPDSYSALHDSTLSVAALNGLLANAFDYDDDTLTATAMRSVRTFSPAPRRAR